MRHLEDVMGEDRFSDGLREYLKSHAFGNATWTDLIEVLDTRTSVDLKAWSRAWVEEPGRPAIATELAVKDGRISKLAFRQTDPWNRKMVWPEQLRVTLGYKDRIEHMIVPFNGSRVEVPMAAGKPVPLYVLPNGGGWAYGAIALDPASLAYLSSSLPDIADPLTRGAAWVTLWDAMLERALPPATLVDLAMQACRAKPTSSSRRGRSGICALRGGAFSGPRNARRVLHGSRAC